MVGAVLIAQGPVFCRSCAGRMVWLKAEAWRRVLTLERYPVSKKKGPAHKASGPKSNQRETRLSADQTTPQSAAQTQQA